MKNQGVFKSVLTLAAIALLMGLAGHKPGLLASVATATPTPSVLFTSPLPMPPAPTPPLPSAEAQVALRYVSEQYGIPQEQLAVVNEHYLEYAELGRAFQAFTLFDPTGRRFFQLLVDLKDHTVVEDVAAIDQAEADAARKKYGKLEPALYERLQSIQDKDVVTVTIRMASGPSLGMGDIEPTAIAAIAAKYPEAQAAVERSGKPMDVGDPALAARIEKDYGDVMNALVAQRNQPLLEARKQMAAELKGQGIIVRADGGPDILSKREISLIAQRDDVAAISLVLEGRLVLGNASAPTNLRSEVRVPTLWSHGAPIAVAVVWGLALPLIYFSWRMNRPAKKGLPWIILGTAVALTLPLLYLSACQPRENDLPFRTIAKGEGFLRGRSFAQQEPDFLVITKPEEIDAPGLDVQFSPELAEQLRALDYQRNFAVVLFRGRRSDLSSHYTIDVLQVLRAKEKILLKVHLGEPGRDEVTLQAGSSPYHIITVSKEGQWAQNIHFVLQVDGKEVKEHTYFIP